MTPLKQGDKPKYLFCVITRVGEKCLYDDFTQKVKGVRMLVFGARGYEKGIKYHSVKAYPFQVGELLILNSETEREIAYPQRKPSKWGNDYDWKKKYKYKESPKEMETSIDFRYFKDLDKAIRFAKKVTNNR